MSDNGNTARCPFCGESVAATAEVCPYCDEPLFEDDPGSASKPLPRSQSIDATQFIIPTEVSGWSMAACYLGLFSVLIPFLGLPLAVIALICGIVALRRRNRSGSYGAVSSDLRAIIGIVISALVILGYGALVLILLVERAI